VAHGASGRRYSSGPEVRLSSKDTQSVGAGPPQHNKNEVVRSPVHAGLTGIPSDQIPDLESPSRIPMISNIPMIPLEVPNRQVAESEERREP
jgi:hypothetical protein